MMDVDNLFVDRLSDLWEIEFEAENHSIVPLEHFELPKRARTMLCHDMMGGYLEQESTNGVMRPSKEPIYLFMHWWNVDIFVYFSHHMVTIPPTGWTNAAHQHGVQMLGTFITEFDEGAKLCAELFADREFVDRTVQKLVDAAVTFEFEGWLVNIENKVESAHLDLLAYFLEELTSRMREVKGEKAMVVWYDSVTVDGELKWQDQLNDKNKQWFDYVDAIYLNYCWDEEKLNGSHMVAQERAHDVFAGVDCFGRGSYGGGQWNCRKAMEAIQKAGLSSVLFAPGWIAEVFPDHCILEQSMKFWNLLSEFLPCRSMAARTFTTNFENGLSPEKFCLSESEIQPIFVTDGESQLIPSTAGLKVEPGTHRLFHFTQFPNRARIWISIANGDAALRFPNTARIEVSLPSLYIVNSDSDSCEISIQTEEGCVLKQFGLICG